MSYKRLARRFEDEPIGDADLLVVIEQMQRMATPS
jgi:hypothetical protein